MKIAIIGYGKQGASAYNYWRKIQSSQITICDKNEEIQLPNGVEKRSGPDYIKNLDDFDLIVRSPIIHPKNIVAANSEAILDKVTTVTNEFLRVCPTKNIIGVTGTKGKGTTSTLITKMLEGSGKKVHLGGNIGIPPLELLDNQIQPEDWVVLELANFQLIDLKYSPPIGVCLLVVPEHLDWHTDFKEYVTAKQQLFARQTTDDKAIYYAQSPSSKEVVSVSQGVQIPYYQAPGAEVKGEFIVIDGQNICRTDEIKLIGTHNWQNVCAAITAVWQVSQNTSAIKQVITTFSGLKHRLQLVKDIAGVKYYDDSFATTPESAIVAIESFKQPKIIILGGSDKGAEYEGLADCVRSNNVKQVIAIGETSPAIVKTLRDKGFSDISEGGQTMTEIVNKAKEFAVAGDVVLLSPACASFGLFKNYEDRGDKFSEAVQSHV